MVKKTSRRWWEKQRNRKVQKYKGMAMYLFEKRNGNDPMR
jgi:hypothetical protein